MSEVVTQCRECRKNHWRWGDCEGLSWYAPPDLHYCWHQVIWLIDNSDSDNWPPNTTETGYVGGHGQSNQQAPYVGIKDHVGEIMARLDSTGDCGQALYDEVMVADLKRISSLSIPAFRALCYVSGWRRKNRSFAQWRWDWERSKFRKIIRNPQKSIDKQNQVVII